MEQVRLLKGDNRELLKTLETNSVDSVVTDPPYALTSIKNRFGKPGSAEAQYGTDGVFQRASKGFMGKEWDSEVPSVEVWKEVLRVLKPGGHVLAFGGTRTYHHLVMNMELAGFEIRDTISYMYGSGFPKSHNIGKAVDKRGGESIGWFGEWLKSWREQNNIPQSKIAELFPSKTGGLTGCVSNWELGNNLPTNEQFNLICKTFNLPFNSLEEAEREFIGTKTSGIGKAFTKDGWGSGHDEVEITKGNSEWEGWGTALKPSMELICLARKPLSEKSIAENVLKHGTGGINIDGCRVEATDQDVLDAAVKRMSGNDAVGWKNTSQTIQPNSNEGRFPANTILECICDEVIPGKKGEIKNIERSRFGNGEYGKKDGRKTQPTAKVVSGIDNYNDKGDIHTNPECPCYILDKQSGVKQSTRSKRGGAIDNNEGRYNWNNGDNNKIEKYECGFDDKGGASRFFYTAKVSKKERNMGLDEITNLHPTVKPINLMTYLCRLITPRGGVVLDMYMGSGSTGISALLEGFNFIGMEMDEDYFKIAEARINNYEQYRQFKK